MSEKQTAPCKKCKQEVELNSKKCPNCGEDYPTTTGKDILKTILGIVVIFIIIGMIFSEEDTLDDTKNTTLKEAKKFQSSKLKSIAETYVKEKQLPEIYIDKFYNCLGELIQEKSEEYTIGKMLNWCQEDYDTSVNHQMRQYFNTTELLESFSPWDGSFRPLEKIIKNNMNDPSTYEHVKTTYGLVYYGKNIRPHMYVKTTFRGTNNFGAVVANQVSVKVDAITRELFDLKNE